MRQALSLLVATWLAATSVAGSDLDKAFETRTYEDSSGRSLPYRLFRPPDYDPENRYPLVIYLHGGGGQGSDNRKQLMGGNAWGVGLFSGAAMQEKNPSFVIAPQMDSRTGGKGWGGLIRPPRESWDREKSNAKFVAMPADEPIDLLARLIDSLTTEFNLDTSRFYVTGQSMGGYGTWGIITRYPELFAAALPICGGGDPEAAHRIQAAVWAFHGDGDRVVPVQQSRMMIEALVAAGKNPRYSELPGVGHNSWEKAYSDPEVVRWLISQRRQGELASPSRTFAAKERTP